MPTDEGVGRLVQLGLGPELEGVWVCRSALLPDIHQHLQRLPDAVPGAVAVGHVDGFQLKSIKDASGGQIQIKWFLLLIFLFRVIRCQVLYFGWKQTYFVTLNYHKYIKGSVQRKLRPRLIYVHHLKALYKEKSRQK